MLKKNIFIIFIFLLLVFAGIIALTQENDDLEFDLEERLVQEESESFEDYEEPEEIPDWVKPERWFRSNAAGMALEEVSSQFSALRNDYALLIYFIKRDDLPEYLRQYYNKHYFIEVREFFEKTLETRTQWIFRDNDGTTRLTAVFIKSDKEKDEVVEYVPSAADEEEVDGAEIITATVKKEVKNGEPKNGFIEIYDENSYLLEELRFIEDEGKTKTNYVYNDGLIIRAEVLEWEEDEEREEYMKSYTDFFRYNRSAFLRSVERIFYKDQEISIADNRLMVAFPYNIMDAADSLFISEKLNPYPEFFGDISVTKNSKIVFTTDDRGRILTQTLYDAEKDEAVIWKIVNVWSNDRISSISKIEGDITLLAEYEYDSGGNRVLERNLRNGVVERVVRTEKTRDIEELYMNNVVVLTAVWENGRKISETRGSAGIHN